MAADLTIAFKREFKKYLKGKLQDVTSGLLLSIAPVMDLIG